MDTLNKTPLLSILHIDNDPCSLKYLTSTLRKKYPSVQLYSADNGKTGLELFKQNRQNIIITSLDLPHMDGIHLVTEIKRLNTTTQIIVLSAHSEERYQRGLSKIGVKHYIQKPIIFKQIFTAIEDCINFQISPSTQKDTIKDGSLT